MAEQVYVTHCLQSDSVKGQSGFSVRATSTQDPDLLRFALEYPAYELPLDMWSQDPPPAQAPRRLALVAAPRGTVALLHSAYLGKDTLGRPGNYFTHVIFYPALTALQALESWGAAEWRTSYPSGETQTLPKASDAPFKAPLLSEKNVSLFLTGRLEGDAKLATQICPERFRGNGVAARTLVGRALQALLLAAEAEQGGRNRLYLFAEPGLVALLLYAAARILPPESTERLTFSTFENHHRSLRQFKLALATGTYTGTQEKTLETEYLTTRGFGFDAFDLKRSSPELTGDPSVAVMEWLDLAAQGKWEVLHNLQQCHTGARATDDSLRAARKLYNTLARAKARQLTADELLDLGKSASGMSLVDKNSELFWPFIYEHSLASDAIRRQFGPILEARVGEIAGRVAQLIAAQDSEWATPWALVKSVGTSAERLPGLWLGVLQAAAKVTPAKSLGPALRIALLQEWRELGPEGSLPEQVRPLLSITTIKDFEALTKGTLPEEWLGYALREAFSRNGHPGWLIQALDMAPDAALQQVVASWNTKKSGDELLALLRLLISGGERLPLFFRLLKNGLTLAPETASAFLDGMDANKHWTQGDNIRTFLGSLTPHRGKGAAAFWQGFCRSLSKDLLLGHSGQRTVYENLVRARAKWEGSAPPEACQALDDWTLLLNLFSGAALTATAQDLEAACQRRGIDQTPVLLKEYFVRQVQDAPVDAPALDNFAGVFNRLYPPADFYKHHVQRFDLWQQIVADTPDAAKANAFKLFFFERHVPAKHQAPLAKERKLGAKALQAAQQATQQVRTEKKEVPEPVSPVSSLGRTPASTSLGGKLRSLSPRDWALVGVVLLASYVVVGIGGCWMGRSPGPQPTPSDAVTGGPSVAPERVALEKSNLNAVHDSLAAAQKALEGLPRVPGDAVALARQLDVALTRFNFSVTKMDAAAVNRDLAALAKDFKNFANALAGKDGKDKKLSEVEDRHDRALFGLVKKRFVDVGLAEETKSLDKAEAIVLKLSDRSQARAKLIGYLGDTYGTSGSTASDQVFWLFVENVRQSKLAADLTAELEKLGS